MLKAQILALQEKEELYEEDIRVMEEQLKQFKLALSLTRKAKIQLVKLDEQLGDNAEE